MNEYQPSFASNAELTCRRVESGDVVELHINVTPDEPIFSTNEMAEFFNVIKEFLDSQNARLFSERVFVSKCYSDGVSSMRRIAYGDLDDGVEPSILVDYGVSDRCALHGVQIHAIVGDVDLEVIFKGGDGVGRVLKIGDKRWLHLSGIMGDGAQNDSGRVDQTRTMFEKARELIGQYGITAHEIARTWLWLDRVCEWYDDFNLTRNDFFVQQGLIDKERGICKLPASTGIGVSNRAGNACALDVLAVKNVPFKLVEAGGNQESAFNYGSAFSRAVVVDMPATETVYISGTAAIDTAGATEYVDQIEEQISSTIKHVRSILDELDCDDAGVVHAIVYCRNAKVLEIFRRDWAEGLWPHISIVADVCRDDLLFEIEATAVKG